ncbi:MFS-type transporter SLC18B1-like, partial [Limulus polyphemus]|uniref:MFS-type transporter SLC18B1-like n=1 Tax=Limulus polyphemus TaxID=6850 RepID=A0ABM1TG78_LIMPO
MGKREETLHKNNITQHQKDASRKALLSSKDNSHNNSTWSHQDLSCSFSQNSTNVNLTESGDQNSCDNSDKTEQVNFSSEISRSENWISTEKEVTNKKTNAFSRRQISVLCSLAIGNLLVGACYSLLAPFFPQEAEKKGASSTEYGMVFSVYELVGFIFAPVYGRLLPILKAKFLTYCGLFVCGSCCILFGFLDKAEPGSTFLILAIAVRIVEGLGGGAYYTASPAIVVSEFSGRTTTAFVGGYVLPFLVLGLLLLLSSVMIFFILPDIEDGVYTSAGYKSLLLKPKMVMCVMVLISGFIFFGYNDATLEPHLRKFNLTPAVLGMIFVAVGGVYACTTPFWGYLCDKGSNPRLLCLVGCVICFISLLLVGPVPFFNFEADLWLIILALSLLGLGLSAKLVCTFAIALQDATDRGFPDDVSTYGMIGGLFACVSSIGAFIGPSLGGYLLDTTGYEYGTLVLVTLEAIL